MTCGYCSRIYSTRTNLEEHIKSRHAGLPAPTEVPVNSSCRPESKCQCNACGKICADAMELNLHGRICVEEQKSDISVKTENRDSNKTVDTSEASSVASDDDSKDYRYTRAIITEFDRFELQLVYAYYCCTFFF